jgi:hypothetical protein
MESTVPLGKGWCNVAGVTDCRGMIVMSVDLEVDQLNLVNLVVIFRTQKML